MSKVRPDDLLAHTDKALYESTGVDPPPAEDAGKSITWGTEL